MGLDQYMYVATHGGAYDQYLDAEYNQDRAKKGTVSRPREIAYRRKHPNLHGWMHALWKTKAGAETSANISFNGIELELTWEDLERLERDVIAGALPPTEGFFYGSSADEYYQAEDLKFIQDARAELFMGLKVFYNSSW